MQGYYDLAAYARTRYKQSSTVESQMLWQERLWGLAFRTGNALIEVGDLSGAKRFLESLIGSSTAEGEVLIGTSQDDAWAGQIKVLRGWLAMLCLRMGELESARRWIDADANVDSDSAEQQSTHSVYEALYSMAEGNYEDAVVQWRDLLTGPNDILATHNLAVCLVYTGHVAEATQVLEDMVDHGHGFHALTFNLATVYELRTERAGERKLQMAERVAERLKSKEDDVRKDRVNGDFKL